MRLATAEGPRRHFAALGALFALGFASTTAPNVALGVSLLPIGFAVPTKRRIEIGIWFLLSGLVILSYGFNNISVIGAIPVPELLGVVLAAFVVSDVVSRLPVGQFRRIATPALLLVSWTLFRLALDVPRFGLLAVRDALPVVDLCGILLGAWVAQNTTRERLERRLSVLLGVALIWFSLYPLRDAITGLSPIVGLQHPVPLLDFTSAALMSCVGLTWFLVAYRRAYSPLVGVAIVVIMTTQARGSILGLLAAVLATLIGRFSPRTGSLTEAPRWPFRRLLLPGVVAFIGLTFLPPLPGRFEAARPTAIVRQVGTVFGQEGESSGSIEARQEWWPRVLAKVADAPLGDAVGVGFGPDLLDGFRSREGNLVRKPHNDVLELYARTGIIGLTLWIAVLAAVVREVRRASRSNDRLARWFLIAQWSFLATALTQPLMSFAYGALVYFVFAGLAIGWSNLEPASSAVVARSANK